MLKQIVDFVIEPFTIKTEVADEDGQTTRTEVKTSRVLLTLFILINWWIMVNNFAHNPYIGYDATHHLHYIGAFSQGRIPTSDDTDGFYYPPVPMVIPAIAYNFHPEESCRTIPEERMNPDCMWYPGKILQYQNILTSIALTFYFLKIAALIRPESFDLRILSLGMLSLFHVYYRTFSMVRGEPLLAFFYIYITFHLLYVIRHDIRKPKWHYTVQLGIAIAGLILCRQWSAFMIPAVIVWGIVVLLREGKVAVPMFASATIAFILAFFLSAWFFFGLLDREDSMIAFSREPVYQNRFFFDNQSPEFYFGLGLHDLFWAPFRPDGDYGNVGYANQVIPIMYSDTWGDYWGYFTIRGPYPGRVMAMSLLPTAILAAGLVVGYAYMFRYLMFWKKNVDKKVIMFGLIHLILFWTMVGYGWFIIQYADPGKGAPIKGSYMLHVYPFLAFLGGEVLLYIKQRTKYVYPALIVLLSIVYIHNLPVYFSQRLRFFEW